MAFGTNPVAGHVVAFMQLPEGPTQCELACTFHAPPVGTPTAVTFVAEFSADAALPSSAANVYVTSVAEASEDVTEADADPVGERLTVAVLDAVAVLLLVALGERELDGLPVDVPVDVAESEVEDVIDGERPLRRGEREGRGEAGGKRPVRIMQFMCTVLKSLLRK